MQIKKAFRTSSILNHLLTTFIFLGILLSHVLQGDQFHELLSEASACNNHLLYEEAIKTIEKAIKIKPLDSESYKERAFSYFELNMLELALEDYHRALNPRPPYRIKHSSCQVPSLSSLLDSNSSSFEFAKGLIQGTLLGAQDETFEFVSSIRGGLSFLWAFLSSPWDVSKELVEAVYEMGEFIAYAKIHDLLEAALPELMECRECWSSWSNFMKGQKMGYIIGKYSIAAFYYLTVWKGASYYSALRRANTMANLEKFSVAQGSQILQESARRAKKNTSLLKKAIHGSVVPHNPNVAPHVLQKKHRWDKYVHLNGNRSEDIKKVVSFLDEIEILKCERELDYSFQSVKSYIYRKNMGRDTIVGIFDVNKEGTPLLKNAWVEPNPPFNH